MTRHSREFLTAGAPLTPELARVHDMETLKLPRPSAVHREDCCVTGKLEHVYARKIERSHATTWRWATAAIVVVFALLGLVVGVFAAAVLS